MNDARHSLLIVTVLRGAIFAVLFALPANPCLAGPNAYGTLVLHQNPILQGSCDGTINGLSGVERCDEAITRVDDPSRCAVVYVLASFPSWQSPNLRSVAFGLSYDETRLSLGNLSPAGDLESPTSGWPAPGSGTAVGWNEPRTGRLVEVYAFSADADSDDNLPTHLQLAPHPTHGATFYDPIGATDPAFELGRLGWGEDGALTCAPGTGACCDPAGGCVVVLPPECESQGGVFLGGGAPCEPGACPEPTGACCIEGECQVLTQLACVQANGRFIGAGDPCLQYTCVPEAGACCLPDGRCAYVPEEICAIRHGAFVGYGADCATSLCPPLFGCGPTTPNGPPRDREDSAPAEVSHGERGYQSEEPSGDPPCGQLLLHTDGTFENGYSWQYGGTAHPYFGAFAEGFDGSYLLCNAVLELTYIGLGWGVLDLYVWDDDDGCPGSVLCARPHVVPGGVGLWPSVSQLRFAMPGCCTGERWWVGYWGAWPGAGSPFYVGVDLDGPVPGRPKTCIAPGLGYPSGWQNVSVVWGPTVAIGIGAEVLPCGPVPVERTSWGKIKALYGPPR
ncbi:MAG: hypothetical protein IT349_14120 [Candidatus Eisenbacteria bacterium]|nr:hypothetical protein [Candidatus Eisenbacteria bacterium]